MYLTAAQAKAIDLKAKDALGISTLVLMENAGRAVADEARALLKSKKRVVIFCGKGNNGGDGFVAARHLLSRGITPDIFLATKIKEIENEAKSNLGILLKLQQKVTEVNERNLALLRDKIRKYDLIIDALLGVGIAGQVRGVYKDLIEIINSSKVTILAVDIPSGLDATTGKVLGCCVKANTTITFIAKKRGMVMAAGPRVCGKILVADLGIPLRSWR